ncbi:MAG: hypothetical protein ACREJG_12365 [Candidatus Rokuibacteriota bacterium]
MDQIKRIGPPTTSNGLEWTVPLSSEPSQNWMKLFKAAGESSLVPHPRTVHFSGDTMFFKSPEDQVPRWIELITQWIAATNDGHRREVDERYQRETTEAREADAGRKRIQDMNQRFKDL